MYCQYAYAQDGPMRTGPMPVKLCRSAVCIGSTAPGKGPAAGVDSHEGVSRSTNPSGRSVLKRFKYCAARELKLSESHTPYFLGPEIAGIDRPRYGRESDGLHHSYTMELACLLRATRLRSADRLYGRWHLIATAASRGRGYRRSARLRRGGRRNGCRRQRRPPATPPRTVPRSP